MTSKGISFTSKPYKDGERGNLRFYALFSKNLQTTHILHFLTFGCGCPYYIFPKILFSQHKNYFDFFYITNLEISLDIIIFIFFIFGLPETSVRYFLTYWVSKYVKRVLGSRSTPPGSVSLPCSIPIELSNYSNFYIERKG